MSCPNGGGRTPGIAAKGAASARLGRVGNVVGILAIDV